MEGDRRPLFGAAAGAIAIVLFGIGAAVIGGPPDFDAPGADVAAHVAENRTRIQVGSALNAAVAPLLIWFLATVASLAAARGRDRWGAAAMAFGCGTAYIALFLADVTALAVSALRPENLVASPELAIALRDFEWLAMGMAAFLGAGMLAAFAVLVLRDGIVWPRWLGWLAMVASAAYALRIGTLFTIDGVFAADGLLGLWVPVTAIGSWILIASVVLMVDLRSQSASI